MGSSGSQITTTPFSLDETLSSSSNSGITQNIAQRAFRGFSDLTAIFKDSSDVGSEDLLSDDFSLNDEILSGDVVEDKVSFTLSSLRYIISYKLSCRLDK